MLVNISYQIIYILLYRIKKGLFILIYIYFILHIYYIRYIYNIFCVLYIHAYIYITRIMYMLNLDFFFLSLYRFVIKFCRRNSNNDENNYQLL